jgi:hypothetical protein
MDQPPEPQPSQPELTAQRPTVFVPVTVQEVEQQCQDLRTLLSATLVALLVLSVSVNLFLAKQMRQVRQKVSESRQVVARMQGEFRKKEPRMKDFVIALQSFALANRDFQPILDRYRAALPQYLTAPVGLPATPPAANIPAQPAPAGR